MKSMEFRSLEFEFGRRFDLEPEDFGFTCEQVGKPLFELLEVVCLVCLVCLRVGLECNVVFVLFEELYDVRIRDIRNPKSFLVGSTTFEVKRVQDDCQTKCHENAIDQDTHLQRDREELMGDASEQHAERDDTESDAENA